MARVPGATDSANIGRQQHQHGRDEFRTAVRALLMTPLMTAAHEDFRAVRSQGASLLRDWFSRETGWVLQFGRDGARLYKRPADRDDPTRGLPGYDRRRYVLLCLVCAALERLDAQVTLRVLGERLLTLAADPALASAGFSFTLGSPPERRELVAVCRTLLDLSVIQLVAGDEQGFVQAGGQGDALYDVHRTALAGMLAAVRGPSTWPSDEMPETLAARLQAMAGEHAADTEEGRRTALRHALARRLLDDPVTYVARLDAESRAYFANQRGTMATRLADATGLVPEQRAEGLAMVDEDGVLTDVAMPAEGTDAHVTLLVAEFLAGRQRKGGAAATTEPEIAGFLCEARDRYGRYWRRSAREPHAERDLTGIAVQRLEKLHLVQRLADGSVVPLPALARFSLGGVEVRDAGRTPATPRHAR